MKRLWAVILLLGLSGCAFVSVPLRPGIEGVKEQVIDGEGKAKIAVVEISGVITIAPFGLERFSKEPPLLPRLKEELKAVMTDEKVVGLVVRLDSPGGSVTASDILYHELQGVRRKRPIPVVACVMDKALSGGYYAALAADEIIAHPTSVVGAVGVVAFKFDLAELLAKWGVRNESVQSGRLKDFWSPLRPSRPEEVAIMQEITDRLHQRFLGLVRERRRLSDPALERIATGRLFEAGEARELGLVDAIGYLDDAVARVKELAGVDKARVVIYRRPGAYAENIYALELPLFKELATLEGGVAELLNPSFRYQYVP